MLSAAIILCAFSPGPYLLLACTLPIAFFSPSLNSVVVGYRTAITPDHLVGVSAASRGTSRSSRRRSGRSPAAFCSVRIRRA